MKIIKGKEIALKIKENVKLEVDEMIKKGETPPCLACIIVEGNGASEVYVSSKIKACEECGLKSKIVRLPQTISQEGLYGEIDKLNEDNTVSGILLQLPLPSHLDEVLSTNRINPSKDVDCLTFENLGKLFSARALVSPCTASGIMKILEHEQVSIEGKNIVVIGRSLLVGKSVANLLEQKNATVTICHSKTKNLKEITKQADILIVAIGKTQYITKDYIKEGSVVIDVGINRTEIGLKGDVCFDEVCELCSLITPVPGGVGPLTVACLMENTLILYKQKKEN